MKKVIALVVVLFSQSIAYAGDTNADQSSRDMISLFHACQSAFVAGMAPYVTYSIAAGLFPQLMRQVPTGLKLIALGGVYYGVHKVSSKCWKRIRTKHEWNYNPKESCGHNFLRTIAFIGGTLLCY